MINKRIKRVLLILPFFLIVIGVLMLFMPTVALAVPGADEPTVCDGQTWNSNGSGSSVTVSGTITSIKIKAGDDLSQAITENGNYGHFIKVDGSDNPDPACPGQEYGSMFVKDTDSVPAGFAFFGRYEVGGMNSSTVTVATNKQFSGCGTILPGVSHLLYICSGDTTTTTDPATTTTTDPGTTTTTDPATTTTTDPATTTTTDPATTTTTAATTTTTAATTTTTTDDSTTTTTAATTTTTAATTTTTTDDSTTTTTTDDTTTTTKKTKKTTTTIDDSTTSTGTVTTGTEQSLAVLALTGFNSLWYVIGSILIGLGIIVGSYSLSTSLKRR